MRLKFLGVAAGLTLAAIGPVSAQDAQIENYELGGVAITVFAHPFLATEEIMTLRLVGQNSDALELFVPEGPGYAALAIAPEEGFVRDGVPVDSAIAISGLQDLATARISALEACDSARQTAQECVIALEVAPR